MGLWSPTADLNTEAAWAIVVFVLIMYYKIKTNGIFSYLKGLLDPSYHGTRQCAVRDVYPRQHGVPSLRQHPVRYRHFHPAVLGTGEPEPRHFRLAAGFLSQLQLFQIGIPAFTGLYFDWFGGCIQAFIFCTLTTIFIKRAAGEE